MSRPAEDCDSPTVEPLRIFKPQSPNPADNRTSSSDRFRYPTPPRFDSPSSSTSSSSKPHFPLPPGASSSAAPLPYPEDEDLSQPPQASSSRPPYPDHGRKPSGPGRIYIPPTVAGGSQGYSSPNYNDTSPRLSMSPIDKKNTGGLAERRGTAPKPLTSPTSPGDDKEELFAKPLGQAKPAASAQKISTAYQNKPYYPPPGGSATSSSSLALPGDNGNGVNRFSSTACLKNR